jgi:hypothetical protein
VTMHCELLLHTPDTPAGHACSYTSICCTCMCDTCVMWPSQAHAGMCVANRHMANKAACLNRANTFANRHLCCVCDSRHLDCTGSAA